MERSASVELDRRGLLRITTRLTRISRLAKITEAREGSKRLHFQ
jgi:hypothetical protein